MAFILRRASRILSPLHTSLSHLPHSKTPSVLRSCVNLKCRSVSGSYNILYSASTLTLTEPDEVEAPQVQEPPREAQHAPSRNKTTNPGKFTSRMKKKKFLLIFYENALKEGTGIDDKLAFKLIKSCGRSMTGETHSTRNELVRYMWDEVEKNGVELNTSLWNTLLSVYIENRFDFEPLEFLKEMWDKSNSEPNSATYTLLAQSYAVKGDPVGAMKIVDFAMQTDGKVTKSMYKWLISAFAKIGDMDGVEMSLSTMRKNGLAPELGVYEELLNVHSEHGDMDSIDKTIQEMMDGGINPTIVTYLGILEHLSISGHADLIEKTLEQIGDTEEIKHDIHSIILQCVCQGEYKSAFLLQKHITEMTGKEKTSYWFYIETKLYEILRYLGKDVNEYMKVSTMMEQYLDEPELSRLSIMIKFLASPRNGQVDDASAILRTFLTDGRQITTKEFHPILQSLADGEKIPEIVDIYKLMLDNGIELDYYCYKNVRHGLGEPGGDKYTLFLELIKDDDRISLPYDFTSDLIKSDDITLNQLVNVSASLQKYDLFKHAKELRSQLLSNFEISEGLTLISVLHEKGYNRAGFVIEENVSKLLKENKYDVAFGFVKDSLNMGVKISSPCYTEMLKYLRIKRRSEDFFDLIRLMNTHGVEPDPHQYFHIIKMASKVGNRLVAQFSFEKIIQSEQFAKKEGELYGDLILAYFYDKERVGNKNGRDAVHYTKVINLFEEMIEKGHQPNNHVIAVVIKSLLNLSDVDGASKLVEKYNTKADFNHVLMASFYEWREFDKAESLFDRIKEQVPHSELFRLYNEMIRIPAFTGDVDKMKKIYQEMTDKEIPTNHNTYASRINTYLKAGQPEACIDIIQEEGEKYPQSIKLVNSTLQKLILTGNIENVQKVIDLATESGYVKQMNPGSDMAKILVNVKAGNFEDASSLFCTVYGDIKENPDIVKTNELKIIRRLANTAVHEKDIQFIENIIQFLNMNNLHDEASFLEGKKV